MFTQNRKELQIVGLVCHLVIVAGLSKHLIGQPLAWGRGDKATTGWMRGLGKITVRVMKTCIQIRGCFLVSLP